MNGRGKSRFACHIVIVIAFGGFARDAHRGRRVIPDRPAALLFGSALALVSVGERANFAKAIRAADRYTSS